MQFDWWTFALQAINFLVLVWLLQRFLYEPIQKAIDDRRAAAEAKATEAKATLADAQSIKRKYQEAQRQIAQERRDVLDNAHRDIEAQRAAALADAKSEAQALIETARLQTEDERAKALQGLQSEIAGLAKNLARVILQETGRQLPPDAMLGIIENALNKLPQAERKRIDDELSCNGANLRIVTSQPLDPDQQGAWQERLAAHFQGKMDIQFGDDASLLAGAELRFPHTVVDCTWSDQLDRITKGLNGDASTS